MSQTLSVRKITIFPTRTGLKETPRRPRLLGARRTETIQNNIFDNGHHAIGLWNWPDGGNVAPSGITIFNNSINNTNYPIALDYHYAGFPGVDNSVISNKITNTGHRAIVVWSTYKNFTIKDYFRP